MRRISAFAGSGAITGSALGVFLLTLTLVGFSQRHLRAQATPAQASALDAKRQAQVGKLVEQLGHPTFYMREQAQRELGQYGIEAFDALAKAADSTDIEVAARAQHLLRMIEIPWAVKGDPSAARRQLEDYESLEDAERTGRIEKLAVLMDDEGLEPLCRIVRYEPSQVLCKLAAVAIMGQELSPLDNLAQRRDRILQALGTSERPVSDWVRVYVQSIEEPHIASPRLAEIIENEAETYTNLPHLSDTEVINGLRKHQVRLLTHLGRKDEALAQMKLIAATEDGSIEGLIKQIGWLKERQAWEVIDSLHERFKPRFQEDPVLLYAYAHAKQMAGDQQAAEQLATQAKEMNPGEFDKHWRVAYLLRDQGLPYSEQEYRLVISSVPEGDIYGMVARFALSEILHDRGEHFAGATLLEEAAKQMDKNLESGNADGNAGREPGQIRARMHYFFACHYQDEGDTAKQIEHLDKAVAEDPLDADALIALYRLPNADAERQAKTRYLIRQAASEFRTAIENDPEPDRPTYYNQYAWLVGNTEGDQHEALQFSRKSLEFSPNTAAYFDTLGRCYYTQGDYRTALRYQTQAVRLEPQSHQMQRQLQLFQRAMTSSEGTP